MLLHPFESVIVTVNVPAANPVIDAVVAELLHTYEYGVVPPVAEAVAPPTCKPLHVTFESTTELANKTVGSVIVVELVVEQPFASVMVTMKVPAASPFIDAVVAALLHAYE